jgi:uncharacterized membrane protein YeaQ/YmgE (transglycosylase-associated protein family)
MTLPSVALSLVCSLLIGSLFHLVVDGGAARLLLYMLLSIAGFAAGQWIASSQDLTLLPIGPVQLGPAILGSLVVLIVGHWLSKVNMQSVDHGDTL